MADESATYDIPQSIRDAVRAMGYPMPYDKMRSHIRRWDDLLASRGDFWDYTEREGATVYRVKRRTIHPARTCCDEWASLIFNDKTQAVCEEQACTDWLADRLAALGFWGDAQDAASDAMGLGTAAFALWVDTSTGAVLPRSYDATMTLPLSWDVDGVTECAFATRVCEQGRELDQLQMHVLEGGSYVIRTLLFDHETGERVHLDGVEDELRTSCDTPTFGVLKPAIPNRVVKFSPYGCSLAEGNADVFQSVDACYDAVMAEVTLARMRVLMPDSMFEQTTGKDGRTVFVPFGKSDTSVFRMVPGNGVDDGIHEWAPAMRTESQKSAYRLAVQTMGQKCGFGAQYWDVDKSGGLKTATEVSSDNSALMRNIKRHENAFAKPVADVCRALCVLSTEFGGAQLPDPGHIDVTWDDSIITDTASEKAQDLAEVNVTMPAWYYAAKWYGMTEEQARAFVPGSTEAPEPSPFEDAGDEGLA